MSNFYFLMGKYVAFTYNQRDAFLLKLKHEQVHSSHETSATFLILRLRLKKKSLLRDRKVTKVANRINLKRLRCLKVQHSCFQSFSSSGASSPQAVLPKSKQRRELLLVPPQSRRPFLRAERLRSITRTPPREPKPQS